MRGLGLGAPLLFGGANRGGLAFELGDLALLGQPRLFGDAGFFFVADPPFGLRGTSLITPASRAPLRWALRWVACCPASSTLISTCR